MKSRKGVFDITRRWFDQIRRRFSIGPNAFRSGSKVFWQGFRAHSTQMESVTMAMEGIEPGVVGLFGRRFFLGRRGWHGVLIWLKDSSWPLSLLCGLLPQGKERGWKFEFMD